MIDFGWSFIFDSFYSKNCTKAQTLIDDTFLL